jgi:hypothetical protein
MNPETGIKKFAATISSQPLGLAYHQPEGWATPARCFENVFEKVRRSGGAPRFGWTFLYRISPVGGYLVATHHAVWHEPNGRLIDVTPFHEDAKHHPFSPGGSVLFLVDDAAQPLQVGGAIGPLPLRFFPLEDDESLLRYMDKLRADDDASLQATYDAATKPPPPSER